MSNFNKIYHKGSYRSGEWAKHLRPYLKRVGNKRWRKSYFGYNDEIIRNPKKKHNLKRTIKVKITKKGYGNSTISYVSKYRTIRDVHNATKQANVIRAIILDK